MCAIHVLKTGDFDHTQRDQERKKNNHCSPGSPNIHEVFPHTRFFFLHNINTSARQTGKIRTYSSAFPLCSPTFPTTPERVLNLVSFMSKCCFRIAHSQFSSYSSLFKGRFCICLRLWTFQENLRLLLRRVCQDHPRNHKVEEEHRVHHQCLAVGRLAVGEEGCGRESRPAEGRRDHRQPHCEYDPPGADDQDNPTHYHGHCKRHDAISQHAQALEERDGATQQLGVEGDDDGAKPHDDEDLGRTICFC